MWGSIAAINIPLLRVVGARSFARVQPYNFG